MRPSSRKRETGDKYCIDVLTADRHAQDFFNIRGNAKDQREAKSPFYINPSLFSGGRLQQRCIAESPCNTDVIIPDRLFEQNINALQVWIKLEMKSTSTARATRECHSPEIGILVQFFIRPNPIDREAALRGRVDKWRPNNEFAALPYGRSRKPCFNQDGRVQEVKRQKVNEIRHIRSSGAHSDDGD